MKKIVKFLSVVIGAALIAPVCSAVPSGNDVNAVSLNTLNGDDMFFKQQGHYTCTLCANAMLLRRTTRLLGGNWQAVTESSCRGSMWYDAGMAITYNYNGISVDNERIYGPSANKIKSLLEEHPEGIVAYDYDYPHAILVTDYTDGKFYCADPANNTPSGRIEVSQSLLDINDIEDYWYVTSYVPKPSEDYKINNKSSINSQKIAVGNEIVLTGAADGGKGGYTYSYYYKNDLVKEWKKFAGGNTAKYKPDKEGKWYFRAEACDSEGVNAVKDFTVAVNKKPVLDVSVEKDAISYGEDIRIRFLASQGAGTFRYDVDAVKPSGASVNLRKNFQYSGFTYHPWEAGTYKLTVKVKDMMGNTASENISFTVKPGPLSNNSVADKANVVYGQNIGFSGIASGGAGGYLYKFTAVKPGGKTVVLRKYTSSPAYSYHPWEEGTYKVIVSVKDNDDNVEKKEISFTVKAKPLGNNASASSSTVKFGSNVTFRSTAEGGSGRYEYKYYAVKPGGARVNLKKFSSVSSYTYHPWEKGTYTIEAVAKDTFGQTAVSSFKFTVE